MIPPHNAMSYVTILSPVGQSCSLHDLCDEDNLVTVLLGLEASIVDTKSFTCRLYVSIKPTAACAC